MELLGFILQLTRRASGAHVIAGSALISSGVAYRLPHLEGCCRHRDVAYTERGERIEDGADNMAARAWCARFGLAGLASVRARMYNR
jgi:hypothetical protein